MKKKEINKNKNMKTAKGYRLKPETHELIKKVKEAVKGDLDKALSIACRNFLESPNQDGKN